MIKQIIGLVFSTKSFILNVIWYYEIVVKKYEIDFLKISNQTTFVL